MSSSQINSCPSSYRIISHIPSHKITYLTPPPPPPSCGWFPALNCRHNRGALRGLNPTPKQKGGCYRVSRYDWNQHKTKGRPGHILQAENWAKWYPGMACRWLSVNWVQCLEWDRAGLYTIPRILLSLLTCARTITLKIWLQLPPNGVPPNPPKIDILVFICMCGVLSSLRQSSSLSTLMLSVLSRVSK